MNCWKKLALALGVMVAGWMLKRQMITDPLSRLRKAGM
jgi:hypothetical protein